MPGVAKFEADIEKDETISILTLKNELIALATSRMDATELQEKDKGVVAKITAVFMAPGTYPRIQKDTP